MRKRRYKKKIKKSPVTMSHRALLRRVILPTGTRVIDSPGSLNLGSGLVRSGCRRWRARYSDTARGEFKSSLLAYATGNLSGEMLLPGRLRPLQS